MINGNSKKIKKIICEVKKNDAVLGHCFALKG
jgi:hypothetical protein